LVVDAAVAAGRLFCLGIFPLALTDAVTAVANRAITASVSAVCGCHSCPLLLPS